MLLTLAVGKKRHHGPRAVSDLLDNERRNERGKGSYLKRYFVCQTRAEKPFHDSGLRWALGSGLGRSSGLLVWQVRCGNLGFERDQGRVESGAGSVSGSLEFSEICSFAATRRQL